MKGIFIVLEGPDGSGTTKHTQLLAERMRREKYDVLLTAEPTEGAIGKEIRSLLHSQSMPPAEAVQLLFCADRAQHVQEVIEPALRSGKAVICDRYSLSTIIYGAATGVSAQWLKAVNKAFPEPDLTIITLPPADVCMERIRKRAVQDQFETELFQRRIYEGYKAVESPTALFVDTSGEKEEVAEYIWQQVHAHFEPISRESITNLHE
ncbi:dTMP kinase [Candidatus Peregrinibacteria bacterium CG10_big_fil_rev_8_21_14_0_10_49_24]|nr:MAG: dTMP kinase [Candidatus Peregrinibacteria bacterium CG11_big_fil_rev_8_21_14_0_20_49_14]PIR50736.1 MAG: dTMP kinase [Candidatus Peregrinibacteria bacterium CG10_big_fil_rev_8_21_14_0_10_49_24]PJA68219.1 MAG: dTMP kinase [Candidatus Peregrinibacteria bacterium CG_4_9_14_3_um_filter_49_12]